MFNQLLTDQLTIEKERLSLVLNTFTSPLRNGDSTTRDQLVSEWTNLVTDFVSSAGTIQFNPNEIRPDQYPLVRDHEDTFQALYFDIATLYLKVRYLGQTIVAVFNQISIEADELVGTLRRIASKIDDYSLYNKHEIGKVVSESFTNFDLVDLNSSKLIDPQCSFCTDEGSLLAAEKSIINVPFTNVIVKDFNGTIGNNFDTTATSRHNDLNALLDSAPNTWVEFEKVFPLNQTTDPLIAVLELSFESSIVNRLTLEPIFFGAGETVYIDDVLLDGKSIKHQLPLASYLNETPEDVFDLNQAASLYSGKLTYNFLPVKAKTVSIKLRTDKAFYVTGHDGLLRNRFAIGIKNLNLYSVKYEGKSESISKPVSFNYNKILLLTAQRPVLSTLGKITYQVSNDNGNTWVPIAPVTENDFTVAEVLNLSGSVFSWRLKFERIDAAFNDIIDINQVTNLARQNQTETVNTNISPVTINLVNKAKETPWVWEQIGCVGNLGQGRHRLKLGVGTGASLTIEPPFSFDHETMSIYVAGERWPFIPILDAFDMDAFSVQNDNIVFNSSHAPSPGQDIELGLDPESLFFVPVNNGYEATLNFSADIDSKTIELEHLGQPSSIVSYILPKNQRVINLKHRYLLDDITSGLIQLIEREPDGTLVTSGVYQTRVMFRHLVNATGKYWIDTRNGTLISYTASSDINTTVISYKYLNVSLNKDFTIVPSSIGFNKLFLPTDKIQLNTFIDVTGAARISYGWDGYNQLTDNPNVSDNGNDVKAIYLSNTNIVLGSLKLPNDIFTSGTLQEVPYFDGETELWQAIHVEEEIIPTFASNGIQTFFLNKDNLLERGGVIFSNTTIFATEVATVINDGEWTIDWTTGEVTVKLASVPTDAGTVSYFYQDPSINLNGRYSVNYKKGIIYTTETPLDDKSISYSYSSYRLHYPMSRILLPNEFKLNADNTSIAINTEQLMTGLIKLSYLYQPDLVSNAKDLTEFYSPLVRDVHFKLL